MNYDYKQFVNGGKVFSGFCYMIKYVVMYIFYFSGLLGTMNGAQGSNCSSGNSPPLPNGPAPSQPLLPQFDNDDLDKLPPLPPGSPPSVPGICDVPLREFTLLCTQYKCNFQTKRMSLFGICFKIIIIYCLFYLIFLTVLFEFKKKKSKLLKYI